ncbi:hypothetical protein AB0903_31095 [Streptomyces sp. NPDC048389]|uniref:hypothetical protein n=1 Tax=Streptomyces sp. NPDC048389 TaxID=3154622 RepID=UPI00345255C7
MTTATTEPQTATVPTEAEALDCSWESCPRPAVVAMRFHRQYGHVHECAQHAAVLREWTDVAESVPLPCPWDHGNGDTWIDFPPELS